MAFAIPGRITESTGVPTGIRTPVTAVKGPPNTSGEIGYRLLFHSIVSN